MLTGRLLVGYGEGLRRLQGCDVIVVAIVTVLPGYAQPVHRLAESGDAHRAHQPRRAPRQLVHQLRRRQPQSLGVSFVVGLSVGRTEKTSFRGYCR